MRPPTLSRSSSRYTSLGWSSSTSQTYSGPLLSLTIEGYYYCCYYSYCNYCYCSASASASSLPPPDTAGLSSSPLCTDPGSLLRFFSLFRRLFYETRCTPRFILSLNLWVSERSILPLGTPLFNKWMLLSGGPSITSWSLILPGSPLAAAAAPKSKTSNASSSDTCSSCYDFCLYCSYCCRRLTINGISLTGQDAER